MLITGKCYQQFWGREQESKHIMGFFGSKNISYFKSVSGYHYNMSMSRIDAPVRYKADNVRITAAVIRPIASFRIFLTSRF